MEATEQAKRLAIRLLARRWHTVHELSVKLSRKGFDQPVIEQVIDEMKGRRYLDDWRFCRDWVAYRLQSAPLGRQGLKYTLREKGVAEEVIIAVLDELLPEDAERELARSLLAKKFKGEADTNANWPRMVRFLQCRGFSPEVIYHVLNHAQ